jgi:hypothetical protein
VRHSPCARAGLDLRSAAQPANVRFDNLPVRPRNQHESVRIHIERPRRTCPIRQSVGDAAATMIERLANLRCLACGEIRTIPERRRSPRQVRSLTAHWLRDGGADRWRLAQTSEGRVQGGTMTFHVRPIVLWREEHTRCEFVYSSSTWTLRLWVGPTMARERIGAGAGPMFRAARLWRETDVKFRFAALYAPARSKNRRAPSIAPPPPDRPSE